MRTATGTRTANCSHAAGRWLLAFLCALALVFTLAAVQPRDAWAGGGYDPCGNNLSTNAGGDPLELTIDKISPTGTSDMYTWTGNNSSLESRPWHSFREEIYSVVIGPGVTSVGPYAFHGCSNLTMVTIPDSVKKVGTYAFAGCSNLKAVVWNGTEAAWKDLQKNVDAEGNSALKSAELRVCRAADTCKNNIAWTLTLDGTLTVWPAKGEDAAFIPDCAGYATGPWYELREEIKAIAIEAGVTAVGSDTFCKMPNLASLKLPDGLKSIGRNAFYECTSLPSVTIPASVELVDGSFNHCNALSAAKFLGAGTLLGNYTFDGCSPNLVVTGYASETPEDGSTQSQAYYCHAAHIPFVAVNGDLGSCKLDLSDGAEVVYNYPAMDVKGYELEALVASIGSQPAVVVNSWYGIDLDGDGNDDIRLQEHEYSVSLKISCASSCNVGGAVSFKLSDKQRILASSGNKYGFYYSSVWIKLSTISLSDCTVGAIKAQTYTGKGLTPSVTVKYGTQTLKAGVDYTVKYSANVNAGTAKVAITGTGVCVGSNATSFKINKAAASAKATKASVTLKAKKIKKKATTLSNLTVKCDKGKASFKNASKNKTAKKFKVNKKTGKVTVPKGTKKGTYQVKVKVTVKAGTNYKKLTKTVSFKVKVK